MEKKNRAAGWYTGPVPSRMLVYEHSLLVLAATNGGIFFAVKVFEQGRQFYRRISIPGGRLGEEFSGTYEETVTKCGIFAWRINELADHNAHPGFDRRRTWSQLQKHPDA